MNFELAEDSPDVEDEKIHALPSKNNLPGFLASSVSVYGKRNWLFLLSTLPVLMVLFILPIQQEMEELHKGRTSFKERVAVLSSSPIDFVVHSGRPRWSIPVKYNRYQVNVPYAPEQQVIQSSPHTNCVRLFGSNETMNADPNSRKLLPRIRRIRIIGERNSGTTLLRRDLMKSFRNVSIESGITRYGYWFQDPSPQSVSLREETLVIHVVLDPYEWFARMQANPIHAPAHRKTPEAVNWTSSTFFKLPWTMDTSSFADSDLTTLTDHCQYKFPFDTVVPCAPPKPTKANKMYPVYELHPQRKVPYPTIVHLRTAKTFNFLNVTSWMPHVVHVRSHDIATMEGVNAFVTALLDRYRVSSLACEITKRDVLKPHELGAFSASSLSNQEVSWERNPPEPLTRWQVKFITCNLDWFMEQELGFNPLENPEEVCPNGYIHHPGGSKQGMLFRFMDELSSNFGRR